MTIVPNGWSIIILISLPLWNVSCGMQITSCLSWFLVQISPSQMPNLGWASSCAIIFAHIVSLWYVFLTMAHKFIVSSMWVCRDLASFPAAMAVTSSVSDISSDGGDFLSLAFRILASIWWDSCLLARHFDCLVAAACSGQLAVICHLGLTVCLHWHRCFLSDYHHLCCFLSSGIGNLLLYCLCHHVHDGVVEAGEELPPLDLFVW